MREMKKVFKTLKDRQEQMQDQAAQQKQQEIEQQAQIAQAQMAQAQQMQAEKIAHDDYQAELDRINKKEIALIAAESKAGPLTDMDASGVPDVLEISKLQSEESRAASDYALKLAEIQKDNKAHTDKMALENRKVDAELRNQDNDLQIAKLNAKNRASKGK
jgi:hypothetical protein